MQRSLGQFVVVLNDRSPLRIYLVVCSIHFLERNLGAGREPMFMMMIASIAGVDRKASTTPLTAFPPSSSAPITSVPLVGGRCDPPRIEATPTLRVARGRARKARLSKLSLLIVSQDKHAHCR
jgi:hypothetical protein